MFTRLTRKGLDICPLPQTYETAVFGQGRLREEANVGVCQSAAAAVVVGGVFVCSGATATAP